MIPHTAASIEDAHAVQIATFMTWGELKRMSPDLAKLKAEERDKLFECRPDNSDDLVPGGIDAKAKDKQYQDESLAFVLTTYYTSTPEYEEGIYLITLGDEKVLHRSTWHDEENNVRLDLPLSQYQSFTEGREGYWTVGLMEIVGGGNEIRAAQISGLLDHLERFGNRKTYLPTNSLITPEQITSPRGTVLHMNPGGEPKHEPAVPYDPASLDLFGIVSKEMDDSSGMQETASGTQDKNVNSGRQAFAIISQVHAGLSEPRENIETGYVRGSRIVMQLARAFFDVPRQLKWEGEDGIARHKAWTRADLTSTMDIRLKAGTLSMLAPAAKAQLAERYAAYGDQVLPLDEFRDIIAGNVGGMVGLQDNPHRLRIQNQIAEWMDGPPEGWREDLQQPVFGPQPFGPAPEPPPVIAMDAPTPENPAPQPRIEDPVLAGILEPVPADELPQVATMRMTEIAKAMAKPKYRSKPPDWRAGLDLEYQHMVLVAQQSAVPQQPQAGVEPQPEAGGLKHDLQEDALQEGAEEPKPAEPYTLRADGRDIQLEGAMRSYGDDGQAYIVIPEATIQRQLQPHIADRGAWQEERERLLATRSENELRAERLVGHFSQLMDADEDGTTLWNWFQDFKANKTALDKDLEIAVLKGQQSSKEASDERADKAESDRRYEEWAPGALRGAVDGILKLDELQDVGLDAQQLFDELSGLGGEVLFWTAPEDMEAWGMRFEKGRTYPHYGRILRVINGHAGVARKLKARHEEVLAAREANRVSLEGGDGGKPVVTASDTPVLAGKHAAAPTTMEEWEASLQEDD